MNKDRFQNLAHKYFEVRKRSLEICEPLEVEDMVVQPHPEVSPPKWHLGHTTWFFEQLILKTFLKSYKDFDPEFLPVFNSYYKSAGKHWSQSQRGDLSRPTVAAVKVYRNHVDSKMKDLLQKDFQGQELRDLSFQLELGMHHEQQHQELLLMDIKRILSVNPAAPKYLKTSAERKTSPSGQWESFPENIYQVGFSTEGNFAYDNESPRHKRYTYGFSIAKDIVTNGEFKEFMDSGGYDDPKYWLSKGWEWRESEGAKAPLYWSQKKGDWFEFSLFGSQALESSAPVQHISYFEADAFATWKGCRLPTEVETEIFLEAQPAKEPLELWSWTSSPYTAYPGFQAFAGKASEYNGKFMCNQYVLKGGCWATPSGHYRTTYRNFYEPHQRWMFSGIRLAKEKK